MALRAKKQILEYARKMIAENRYDNAMDLLLDVSGVREDYDLSCMLAKTFIKAADEKQLEYFEAAEVMLLGFRERGENDPYWHELIAQSLYYQNFRREAALHLSKVFSLVEDASEARENFSEAAELLDVLTFDADENFVEYDQCELNELKQHIEKHFGTVTEIIPDAMPLGVRADIYVISPDEKRGYYTLVTVGMGAYKMDMPREVSGRVPSRAELVCYLPGDWDTAKNPFEKCWQAEQMSRLAHLPSEQDTWVGYGFMLPNGIPFESNTELCSSALINLQDADDEAEFCKFSNGNVVCFYQYFPVYIEETKYVIANGMSALIDKMPHISAVIDLKRKNVCRNFASDKAAALVGKEEDMLEGIDVGRYCAASRRITDDGCKVGYMRRFFFSDDEENDDNDSGWMILAGDETPEYLSKPFNLMIFRLNTICNIDREIVPFLTLPYETEVVRGEDGKLKPR